MPKKILFGILCLVVAGIGLFILVGNNDKNSEDIKIAAGRQQSHKDRTISFSLTVRNTSSLPQKKAELLIYIPNNKTAVQQCSRLSVNFPYTVLKDSLNNRVARFVFDTIPPFGTKIITLSARITLTTFPKQVPLKDKKIFLAEVPYIELSSVELIRLAGQFNSDSPKQSARKIYNWVTKSLRPVSYSGKEHGALYAFRKKKGDCTEFTNLFVALCRLNQIPARRVSGFILQQDKQVQANDYHDWAEVYIDGTWQLVDPFNRVFMQQQDQYISMRIHGNDKTSLIVHRWQSDNDSLKIAMTD